MKVAVIGGTGYIGNHVVPELLNQNFEVIVTGTIIQNAFDKEWYNKVEFLELDINNIQSEEVLKKIAQCDKVINLAWSGLPNYKDLFHFENNLMPQYFFIKKLVEFGLKDVLITGTCFEYGMKEGCLSANLQSDPQNPYSLSKDSLRKFLQQLQTKLPFDLKWVRLFYMYGKGQSEKSILSQLDAALENGDKSFNMSGGEQLRDYLPVEEVAKNIIKISIKNGYNGITNCCSGKPISIRKLVENHLKEKGKSIFLNFEYYPYTDYEPMAFWGEKIID